MDKHELAGIRSSLYQSPPYNTRAYARHTYIFKLVYILINTYINRGEVWVGVGR